MQLIKYIIITVASLYAAYTDYKYYKIKNSTTVTVAMLGFVLSLFDSNIFWWESLLGFLLPFFICLVFYIFKMLRAGDVKLFMCIGAVMGYKWILNCMIASVLIGGVISAIVMIKRRCFFRRFKWLFTYFKNWLFSGVFVSYSSDSDKEGLFPFGISISAGVILTIILEIQNIHFLFN